MFRPITELYDMPVPALINALCDFGWKYRYGMTLQEAVRFLLDYQQANESDSISLTEVFGGLSKRAGSMIIGLTEATNPIKHTYALLKSNDPALREAVTDDLDCIRVGIRTPVVTESLAQTVFTGQSKKTDELIFPVLSAFIVLAVEKNELLDSLTPKTPVLAGQPGPITAYCDAVNAYHKIFNPNTKSKRWSKVQDDGKGSDLWKQFRDDLYEILFSGVKGLKVTTTEGYSAIKRLGTLAQLAKTYASPMKTFLTLWHKKAWGDMLAMIPPSSDVYPLFAKLVNANPVPAAGIAPVASTTDIATHIKNATTLDAKELQAVSVESLAVSKTAADKGTPLTVGSVLSAGGKSWTINGAAASTVDGGAYYLTTQDNGEKGILPASFVEVGLNAGSTVVTHTDGALASTKYANVDTPATKKPAIPKVNPATETEFKNFLLGVLYDSDVLEDEEIKNSLMADLVYIKGGLLHTSFKDFVKSYNLNLQVGASFLAAGHKQTVAAFFKDGEGDEYIILTDEAGKPSYADYESLKAYAKDGKLVQMDAVAEKELADLLPKDAPAETPDPYPHFTLLSNADDLYCVIEKQNDLYKVWDMHLHVYEYITAVKMGDYKNWGVITLNTIQEWYTAHPPMAGTGHYATHFENGSTYIMDGLTYMVLGSVKNYKENKTQVVGYCSDTTAPSIYYVDIDDIPVQYSSNYEPEKKDISGSEDALDEASEAMSYSDSVEDYIIEEGFTFADPAESESFTLDLADMYKVGVSSVTILAYVFKDGEPGYIIYHAKNGVDFQTTEDMNDAVGDYLGQADALISTLKPKPGGHKSTEIKAKLNYALEPKIREYLEAAGYELADKPSSAKWGIGAVVGHVPSNYSVIVKVIAYAKVGTSVMALVGLNAPDSYKNVSTMTVDGISTNYDIVPNTVSGIDEDGALTLSVADKDAGFTDPLTSAGIDIAAGDYEYFMKPLKQPVFQKPQGGGHIAAGMVCVQSPGIVFAGAKMAVNAMKSFTLLMVRPANGFNGYSLTFPKGTVDKGESVERAALRECKEESGAIARPIAYLGDYKGKNSITRFFVGHAVRMDMSKVGSETDGVCLVPISKPDEDPSLAYTMSCKWYKELTKREKAVISDLFNVFFADTNPSKGVCTLNLQDPQTAADYHQVSFQSDTEATKSSDVPVWVKPDAPVPENLQPLNYTLTAGAINAVAKASEKIKGLNLSDVHTAISACPTNSTLPAIHSTVLLDDGTPLCIEAVMQKHFLVGTVDSSYLLVKNIKTGLYQLANQDALGSAKTVSQEPTTKEPSEALAANRKVYDSCMALTALAPWPCTKAMAYALAVKITEDLKDLDSEFNYVDALSFDYISLDYGDECEAEGKIGYAVGRVRWGAIGKGSKESVILFGDQGFSIHPTTTVTKTGNEWVDKSSEYVVDDPTVMEYMKSVTTMKEYSLKYINLAEFKKTWKAAGLPNVSKLKKKDIKYAAMLVTGAPTVLQSLYKTSMLESESVKKDKAKAVKQQQTEQAAAMAELAAKSASMVGKSFTSSLMKNYVDNPNPDDFSTEKSGVGGSNPTFMLKHKDGSKWFFKVGKSGQAWRAKVDRAAYLLADAVKGNNIPVGVMKYDGKLGGLQPWVGNGPSLDPAGFPENLKPDDMAEILSQHAFDMFVGDHDGHFENWLLEAGKLVPIDRGQSFKFLTGAKPNYTLDPFANGGNAPDGNNVLAGGACVGKLLLKKWAKSECNIPDVVFAKMHTTIKNIAGLGAKKIVSVLNETDYSDADKKNIVKNLNTIRETYEKDWFDQLSKLAKMRGETFDWKMEAYGPIEYVTDDYIDARSQDDVESAKDPQIAWYGRSMRCDSSFIENQEVMLRQMQLSGSDELVSVLFFKLTARAITAVRDRVAPKAKEVTYVTGPQPLNFDGQGKDSAEFYFGALRRMIGHVNYHIYNNTDGVLEQKWIDLFHKCVAELKEVQGKTAGSGTYKNYPNEVVHEMTVMYLQHAEIIQEGLDNVKTLAEANANLPQSERYKLANIEPFTWDEDAWNKAKGITKEEKRNDRYVFKHVKGNNCLMPTTTSTPGMKHTTLSLTFGHLYNANSDHEQYHMSVQGLPDFNAVLNISKVTSGVASFAGQVYITLRGELAKERVAAMLHVFETGCGVPMRPATKQDKTILYLSTQATSLQADPGEIYAPSQKSGIVNPVLKEAMKAYESGESDAAEKQLRTYLAQRLKVYGTNVDPNDIESLPGFSLNHDTQAIPGQPAAGFGSVTRLGWTREKLVQFFGPKPVFVGHRAGSIMTLFKSATQTNFSLLANAIRPAFGVPIGLNGSSPGADIACGGGSSIFCCLRTWGSGSAYSDHLYFDISLLLRNDVIMVGDGSSMSDAFGNLSSNRATTPEAFKKLGAHTDTGSIGAGSPKQINVRNSIDLRRYLHTAVFSSKSSRDEIRNLIANTYGSDFKFGTGRSINQVIVVQGEETL